MRSHSKHRLMHKCAVDTVRKCSGVCVFLGHFTLSRYHTSYSITNINNINILPKDGCNCHGKTSTADQQTDQWEQQYDTESSQEALYNVVPQTIDMSCHAFTNETCNKQAIYY